MLPKMFLIYKIGEKRNILPVYIYSGRKISLESLKVKTGNMYCGSHWCSSPNISGPLPSRDSRTPLSAVCFPWFQLPLANCGPKILNGKFRSEQFIHFELPAILSVWRSLALTHRDARGPSLRPASPLGRRSLPFGPGVALSVIRAIVPVSQCLRSSNLHFTYKWVPEHKSGDAGNLDIPKRSCKMLPCSEKWNFSIRKVVCWGC